MPNSDIDIWVIEGCMALQCIQYNLCVLSQIVLEHPVYFDKGSHSEVSQSEK